MYLMYINGRLRASTVTFTIFQVKSVGLASLKAKWVARLGRVHFAAVLLDPRAKHSQCLKADQRAEGMSFIREQLATFNVEEVQRPSSEVDPSSPEDSEVRKKAYYYSGHILT